MIREKMYGRTGITRMGIAANPRRNDVLLPV